MKEGLEVVSVRESPSELGPLVPVLLDGAQAAYFLRSVVRRLEVYGPDTPLA